MPATDEDDAAVVEMSGVDDLPDLREGSGLEVDLRAGVEGAGPSMVAVI